MALLRNGPERDERSHHRKNATGRAVIPDNISEIDRFHRLTVPTNIMRHAVVREILAGKVVREQGAGLRSRAMVGPPMR
jgi:hypothetical protein